MRIAACSDLFENWAAEAVMEPGDEAYQGTLLVHGTQMGRRLRAQVCLLERGPAVKIPVTVSRTWRFAVLAVVVAGLAVTPAATQGQPVLAGQINTETSGATVVVNTSFGTDACPETQRDGLFCLRGRRSGGVRHGGPRRRTAR